MKYILNAVSGAQIGGINMDEFFIDKENELNNAKKILSEDFLYTRADLLDVGITNAFINEMIQNDLINEIEKNILIKNCSEINDFLIRQTISPKGIYSYETALYLHDLTDKFPYEIYMTFPTGYKLPKKSEDYTINVIPKLTREKLL